MATILRILIALIIVTAGLLLGAGVLAVSLVVMAVWGVHVLWLKLTGRPLVRFTGTFTIRRGPSRAAARKPAAGDVIDVEARQVPEPSPRVSGPR